MWRSSIGVRTRRFSARRRRERELGKAREAVAFRLAEKGAGGFANGRGDLRVLAREFWREPREEADEIVSDENLAVAVCAGADADSWDLQRGADALGDVGFHEFEDDRECARVFNRKSVGEKRLGGLGRFPFDLVPAFFADALREHAIVADGISDRKSVV